MLSGTALADQYLCVADKMTGIKYMTGSKSWETTDFKENLKFKILNKDIYPKYKYVILVTSHNEDPYLPYFCNNDFDNDYLRCEAGANQFIFNRKTNRFTTSIIQLSYVDVKIEGDKYVYSDQVQLSDSSAKPTMVAIGRCSLLKEE